jgi:hypothetical protein
VFCCGNDAKLLQQAQIICTGPTFHDLAIGDAVDVGSRFPPFQISSTARRISSLFCSDMMVLPFMVTLNSIRF